jgi:hypothetical protein
MSDTRKAKPDGTKEAVLDLRILHGEWQRGTFKVVRITPLCLTEDEHRELQCKLDEDAQRKLNAES